MRTTLVLLAGGLLLAVSTPALAATSTFQGTASLPFSITGTVTEHAEKSALVLAGSGGAITFTLTGQGKATEVIERAYPIIDHRDPSARVLWDQKVERVDHDLSQSTLSLSLGNRFDGFQLLAHDASADFTPVATTGSTPFLFATTAVRTVETVDTMPQNAVEIGRGAPYAYDIPAGLFGARASDGTAIANGDLHLFIAGAQLGLGNSARGLPAYERDETPPGSVYDPIDGTWTGGGSHPEHVREYVLIEATNAHFEIRFNGLRAAPASLYAAQPVLAVDGQAVLPHVVGTVVVTDKDKTTTHTLRGEDLTLGGKFTLAPQADASKQGSAKVSGNGDITTVSYGAVVAHYDWATAVVAVGLGAALVAAIAWAVANGKTLLGLGGGGLIAGYARVHGDEILEHPGRAEVYERVKAFPGVNFVQLSEQVDFGTSTLNYHLRVLEKNGFVTSVRDGRYLRFFDRKSGHYSNQKKFQVSALRNTTTAAMAQHIRANPGVAQCDLAIAFGVTASTVTWHINRLAGQGLVTKTRDAHRTRYFIGEAWANLPADEQARQTPAPVAVAVAAV